MLTVKRQINDIDTTVGNYNKFFNHMNFKGILDGDNKFAVDQESFANAKNIYVDSEERLVSRPTLQKDVLPAKIQEFINASTIAGNHHLIDIVSIGAGKAYVLQATTGQYVNKYTIVFIPTDTSIIIDDDDAMVQYVDQYNLSIIDHYIICFNTNGARIIDVNSNATIALGWQDFEEFVDIPIIKRVIGSQETEYPKNEFTQAYKEEYIWSNTTQTELPKLAYTHTFMTIQNAMQHASWFSDNEAIYIISENAIYIYKASDNTLILSQKYTSVVKTENKNYNWKITDIDKGTDYRLLRAIENVKIYDDDLLSFAKGRICIARDGYFLISYNASTFTTVYYPAYSDYRHIASISDDGQYFFFVAKDGVYRCNLGSLEWTHISVYNNANITLNGKNNCCRFLNGDTFSFITYNETDNVVDCMLYWQGPGLYMGNDYRKDSLGGTVDGVVYDPYVGYTDLSDSQYSDDTYKIRFIDYDLVGNKKMYTDCDKARLNMSITSDYYGRKVANIFGIFNTAYTATSSQGYQYNAIKYEIILGGNTWRITSATTLYHNGTNNILTIEGEFLDPLSTGMVINSIRTDYSDKIDIELNIIGSHWQHTEAPCFWNKYRSRIILSSLQLSILTNTIYIQLPEGIEGDLGAVFPLSGGYIADTFVYDNFTGTLIRLNLPLSLNDAPFLQNRKDTWVVGDKFYILDENNVIYTNNLQDSDVALIDYTYYDTNRYTKVPNVSYSDTNLYLGFDNLLQITRNTRDDTDTTKMLFNLPSINNQSFVNNITGLINISSTEIAVFFEDKITICAKVEDSNLESGYRYDYYNTKLSTGIRLGDSVINTLEGSYTIFPTKRGLAVMNYQAFMATSDQILTYLTDTVKDLWNSFYSSINSQEIHIIQWRNKLILTNQSNTMLIYDLEKNAWWKWELPVNVFISQTDQLDLKVINKTLLIFEDAPLYYDFSKSGERIAINWQLVSQPLHFNAPTHYKNIKQLIFQFRDSDTSEKTMDAQIKLYRKAITIREPETIKFRIEELRTFVKRFNYWKINELQWAIANDTETFTPKRLELDGISIKYEIGEEVR